MLQNKLHVFVARFSVPSGIRKIFACGIRNPKSGKKLESRILGFRILNLSKKIRNPTYDRNPESMQVLLTNPESKAWKPESKAVLDSITRGETSRKGLS